LIFDFVIDPLNCKCSSSSFSYTCLGDNPLSNSYNQKATMVVPQGFLFWLNYNCLILFLPQLFKIVLIYYSVINKLVDKSVFTILCIE